MKIIRARHMGMCFGVRDAIDLALRESKEKSLTIFGELVHNESVLQTLREEGIQMETDPGRITTRDVLVTAHGISDAGLRDLQSRGFHVSEATCPLVHAAHAALKKLVAAGYHPVIVGKRGHVEVRGLAGDFPEADIILEAGDLEKVKPRERFGVISQTTQPVERVRNLVQHLRERFPESEVRFIDTVCRPTKERQTAAVELAQSVDVVIVIGGTRSNNTRELVDSCRMHCPRVHHVTSAGDLERDWFHPGDRVGLTAGTSTPEEQIQAVEERLRIFSTLVPV